MSIEVLGVDDVAVILGCSRRRVFELLAEETLERAPRFGRAVRIYRASVDRALLNGRSSKPGRKARSRTALPQACTLDDFRDLIR